MHDRDPIVAISTPPGRGAIGIVRLSGEAIDAIVQQVFRPVARHEVLRDRRLHLGDMLDRDGEMLDRGLLLWMVAPRSYTGEDVVELHCHGNPTILNALVDAAIHAGARLAGPGEFTQRAFLNGKLDLVQADAVARLISAESLQALRAAHRVLAGELSRMLATLRAGLMDALAHLEAAINFPEDDIETAHVDVVARDLERLAERTRRLAESHGVAQRLGDGLEVAICGAPNVGKSSLLNALVGRRRAIVGAEPGTTRDVVEARADFGGIRVQLLDTAGVREGARGVEAEGIALAWDAVASADIVFFVVDGSQPPGGEVFEVRKRLEALGAEFLVVANKADLGIHAAWAADDGVMKVSALRGDGLAALKQRIIGLGARWDGGDRVLVLSQWQKDMMDGIAAELAQASDAIRRGLGVEAACDNLYEAAAFLDRMVGGRVRDDLVDQIFETFCIGK